MSDEQRRDQLFDLARSMGVQTEYTDVRGQRHRASVDALVAVMAALGLPIGALADVPAVWAEQRHRRAQAGVEPVLLAQDSSLVVPVRPFPPGGGDRVHLTLVLEDGTPLDLGAARLASPSSTPSEGDGGDAVVHQVTFTGEWPVGYHTAVLELPDGYRIERPVIAAPATVAGPSDDYRGWGVFAPLYALNPGTARSGSGERRVESGRGPDVSDLDRLGQWAGRFGADVVATLPLLASFVERPYDPSPYNPVSRLFWNELYLDLSDVAESGDQTGIDRRLATTAVRAELDHLAAAPVFPTRHRADLVRRILAEALAAGAGRVTGGAGLEDEPARADLERYARFRAEVDATGSGWLRWPAATRGGDLSRGTARPADVTYHWVAQLAMDRQLRQAARALRARDQRLYLDLPVGVHPEGFDTWNYRHLFASGVSIGAPPDDFFSQGQVWGMPPVVPSASRAEAHRYWRACLVHHMKVAGILRLDHVMAMHRLFWVPSGLTPSEGVYVRYPHRELLAVLAIESHRHDCWIVGEDLGTVPDEVRESMARRAMMGMYVAEFETSTRPESPLDPPGDHVVASLDTHDTPTLAGFVTGTDIERRQADGHLDPDDTDQERMARRTQVDNLVATVTGGLGRTESGAPTPDSTLGLLPPVGEPGVPAVRPARDVAALAADTAVWLADSACPLVLVAPEDLWGELEPQNIPGTPVERPNWVYRFPGSLAVLAEDPRVSGALVRINEARIAQRTGLRSGGAAGERRTIREGQ